MPSLSRFFSSGSSASSGSGHGSKRTQGPPTPDSTPGSALGAQLEREALHSSHHNDEKLLYHLIQKKTPGHVTIVCLLQERSLIEHQYLMMRVESDTGSQVSWIRAERMGYSADEQALLAYDQRKQARVVLRVAPLWENLINSGDKIILRADLHGQSAKLIHVANLTWIVHNNKTRYNLLHRNCWWFARRILANLAASFMEEGPKRQEVLAKCEEEESRHARAAYGLGHNKKLQRAVGFLEEVFDPSIIDYYKDIQEGGEDLGLWIFEESVECVKVAFDEYLKKK